MLDRISHEHEQIVAKAVAGLVSAGLLPPFDYVAGSLELSIAPAFCDMNGLRYFLTFKTKVVAVPAMPARRIVVACDQPGEQGGARPAVHRAEGAAEVGEQIMAAVHGDQPAHSGRT